MLSTSTSGGARASIISDTQAFVPPVGWPQLGHSSVSLTMLYASDAGVSVRQVFPALDRYGVDQVDHHFSDVWNLSKQKLI